MFFFRRLLAFERDFFPSLFEIFPVVLSKLHSKRLEEVFCGNFFFWKNIPHFSWFSEVQYKNIGTLGKKTLKMSKKHSTCPEYFFEVFFIALKDFLQQIFWTSIFFCRSLLRLFQKVCRNLFYVPRGTFLSKKFSSKF